MRIDFEIDIDSRDGSSAKDARLTNMLVETGRTNRMAGVRPGITQYAATGTAAAGQGLVCFNGTFCAIYGGQLYKPSGASVGTGVALTSASVTAMFDFTQSPT